MDKGGLDGRRLPGPLGIADDHLPLGPDSAVTAMETVQRRTGAASAVRRALSLSREALVGPAEVGDVATGLTTATGPEL